MASLQIYSFLSPKLPTTRIETRARSFPSFLDLAPESKPETLSIDIQYHEPGSKPDYDAAVIGCGPAGLRLAEQASARGIRVCCVDPDPLLGWPNNYGSWVDEFEDMGLESCLDYTWPLATVVIDDEKAPKHLGRPYGRVSRGKLKRRLVEGCAEHGVRFHKAKAWTVDHEVYHCQLVPDPLRYRVRVSNFTDYFMCSMDTGTSK